MKIINEFFLLLFLIATAACSPGNKASYETDVLIIGGGASGTMAGIQAARMGAKTIIAEEGIWLGGMLTSAGVSAIDGNHNLPSGLWNEFRQNLYKHYGGPGAVNTGWVSQVLFEPSVGDSILKSMAAAEKNLSLRFETTLKGLEKTKNGWRVQLVSGDTNFSIETSVLIDATELGDVAKMAGVPYDIGMDSRLTSHEEIAPLAANDIVQDLTYVAVLKDFGPGADKTIPKPENYDASQFYCTCAGKCNPDSVKRPLWDCNRMMQYGKLPNGKYMINWPFAANDFYVNVVDMSPAQRDSAFAEAKLHTLRYVYYLQDELGFKHLGIADNEFPTADGLPFFPYHRESRRIHGKIRFTINDLARPFEQKTALYRTGIAVGDYPVDHHHDAYPDQSMVPDLHFYPVPSYALPLGTLIPETTQNFIVAEKSISVTNLVNGTTRLQPVAILIGQAAGTLAALSVQAKVTPTEVAVRDVQHALLDAGAYIMPYSDVKPETSYFKEVQRIGATGILKGEGRNVGWANHTLFHPDSLTTSITLSEGLSDLIPGFSFPFSGEFVTAQEAIEAGLKLSELLNKPAKDKDIHALGNDLWRSYDLGNFDPAQPISRAQAAVVIDQIAQPFGNVPVNLKGETELVK